MAFLGILDWDHHIIFGILFVDLGNLGHQVVVSVSKDLWAQLLKLILVLG